MTVIEGRQHATTLVEIRRDHVERYRFAALHARGTVADLGCGIGYGSNIMATAGRKVHAYDKSADAISFGEQHWDHPNITWIALPLEGYSKIISDWAVCFEVIEHLENPLKLLQSIKAPLLICSVPNEDVMPFDPKRHSYHHRHYTRDEFGALLTATGWRVTGWHGQQGKQSPVEPDVNGMTLIAMCER